METLPFAALKHKLNRGRIPLFASVEITNQCNLRCSHCYVPEADRTHILPVDRIRDIVDQLSAAGTMEIVLTGGEPLTHPDLITIVEYIVTVKRMNVIVFSNGGLLNRELIAGLAGLPFLTFDITLYGFSESVYQTVTGVDARAAVYSGVDRLRSAGIRVAVKMQVLRENYHEFAAIREYAKGLELPFRYSYYIAPDWRSGRENQKHLLDDNQLRNIMQIAGDIGDADMCDRMREQSTRRGICSIGKSTVGITATGEVIPCVSLRMPAGNITRELFTDIWQRSAAIRESAALTAGQLTGCRDCQFEPGCFFCPGLAHADNDGGWRDPSRQMCRLAEIRYERLIHNG